jgi:hypothetical protein
LEQLQILRHEHHQSDHTNPNISPHVKTTHSQPCPRPLHQHQTISPPETKSRLWQTQPFFQLGRDLYGARSIFKGHERRFQGANTRLILEAILQEVPMVDSNKFVEFDRFNHFLDAA